MFNDYFIKANDEQDWINQARAANLLVNTTDLNGNVILVSAPGISIDVVGNIFTPGSFAFDTTTGNITVITPPVQIDGFHVNIRSQEPINTTNLSLINEPNKPVRVWF